MINYILGSDAFQLFIVCALAYVLFWIHRNRKIILGVAIVAIVAYGSYLWVTRNQLQREINLTVPGIETPAVEGSNNPGNIRVASVRFAGELPSDGPFKKFRTEGYGFRAMAKLLRGYVRSGHNTIERITNRYAPKGDGANDPSAYARTVSKACNIAKDKELTDQDFRNGAMMNILYSMARVEQGRAPSIAQLSEGYQMFLREDM